MLQREKYFDETEEDDLLSNTSEFDESQHLTELIGPVMLIGAVCQLAVLIMLAAAFLRLKRF